MRREVEVVPDFQFELFHHQARDSFLRPKTAGPARRKSFFTGLKKVTKERTYAALGTCVCLVALFLLTIMATAEFVLRGKETKEALPSGPPR